MNINKIMRIIESFPRVNLGVGVTAIQELKNYERKVNYNPIFIKRDDLNGMGIGGNKVRNLEFLLGDAIDKGCDTIIVSGQEQSNLCSLTAAACRSVNLDCKIVHNNYEPEQLEGNAILNHILGADIMYLGNAEVFERDIYVEVLKDQLIKEGKRPYVIRNGASTPIGSLGYVKAVFEICSQMEERQIEIKNFCIPGGNGGLAAGFIFGTGIAGKPFHVDVLTVEHTKEDLRKIMDTFIEELEKLTKLNFPFNFDEVATIHDNYRGGGWGEPTKEAIDFIYEFARTEGIFVEKVYTSKTLYGMHDLIRRGYFKSGVCFLHSGGTGALFSQF